MRLGKPLKRAWSGNMEVTPAAKRQRRCVQSKLCLVPSKGGSVVLWFDEKGEKKISEENTGKGTRTGKGKMTATKQSPLTTKGLRKGSINPSKSPKPPGNNSCMKLTNQNGNAIKSDATEDFDSQFMCPEKPTSTCNICLEAKLDSKIHLNDFSSILRSSEDDHQDEFHKERLSYHGRLKFLPMCSLWTSKYRPENAFEVCGNHHSVKQLNEWLKSWYEKTRSVQTCKIEEHHAVEDSEDGLYKTESDTDQDAPCHRNVLLITGPVGSGKSAAIYACAQEQGFSVIEVSASDSRDAASIKKKFWGIMGSHRYKRWCFDNYNITTRNQNLNVLPSKPGSTEDVKFENLGSITTTNELLIVFDNVDAIFEEDRGFISSILHLAKNENQPIILTSNKKNPVLPPQLDQLVLNFELPSFEELFRHVHMICAYEKIEVPTHILQQLIHHCECDIRKIIMLLQLLCQGKNHYLERNLHMCSPLCYNVDAAHCVLPILIPWGFKCELSEKVDDEISRRIFSIEENLKLVEPSPTEKGSSVKMGKMLKVSCKKRKRKLSRKILDPNSTEFPANENYLDDFFDSPEYTTSFNQGVKRRKQVITSSQSDDKQPNVDEFKPTEVVSADVNNSYTSADPILKMLQIPKPSNVAVDSTYQSQGYNGVQNLLESITMTSASRVCRTFKLQDVSCVPESSFLSGFDSASSIAVSSNIIFDNFCDFVPTVHSTSEEANNLNGPEIDLNLSPIRNINEVDFESAYDNEGLGDSQNAIEKLPMSGFQFLDEGSRADFSIGVAPPKCESSSGAFSVQETWQKLRNQQEELKQYLSRNERETSIVDVAAVMTDLISVTDIMFSGCNPLISDVLEPSSTPSIEPDDVSWYDEHYRMGSTYSQQGLCFLLKEREKACQDMNIIETGVLVPELLASSTNPMAIVKLLSLENTNKQSAAQGGFHTNETGQCISARRKTKSVILDTLLPIVPARLSMALRGSGFHDYLTFTSRISKLENARISLSMKEACRRRSRSSRHYLSYGSLSLSPKDIELLARTSCFKEAAPPPKVRSSSPLSS